MNNSKLLLICLAFGLCCSLSAPASADDLGSNFNDANLKLKFSQSFTVLPKLHSGAISESTPKPLDDPNFAWNSGGRYTKAARTGILPRTATFKEPAMDWDPSQSALVPNGDMISLSGVSPYSIKDGKLVVTVDRLPASLLQARPEGVTAEYMAGQLNSYPFAQRYGYFEARMKLAEGKGLRNMFWLLPSTGGWPPGLTIMDMVGKNPLSFYNILESKLDGNNVSQSNAVPSSSLVSEFHLYGMDWGPETIRFYFDRKLVFEKPTPADAHQSFYIVLQLTLGGENTWPGPPDNSTPFPSSMSVDYVKVWQRPQYE